MLYINNLKIHIMYFCLQMFSPFKLTIFLTSLEIWSDKNWILGDGDSGEILQRFDSWKDKYLPQRSYEITYLLMYEFYLY